MLKLSTGNILKIGAFSMSVILSLMVTSLSCYKLIKSEDVSIFVGLLTGTLSLWMPSPTSLLQIKQSTSTTKTVIDMPPS